LRAPSVAKAVEGYRAELAPRELYAKGNYYSLTRKSPFTRLVYPVPEPGGLGVHVTLDLAGQARFGPDVEWMERIGQKEDYAVDPRRSERFYAAIRRYWPGLPDGALAPGYAGIRPKTAGPGEPAPDFEIQGPKKHGVPGLVHLFGIESPGLTASLALAGMVLDELH
jgi:L-2-hydroxyglutarate oxidase LhgO